MDQTISCQRTIFKKEEWEQAGNSSWVLNYAASHAGQRCLAPLTNEGEVRHDGAAALHTPAS